MPDQHLRTEGDYEIWASDGIEYRRWAKGNSKGKAYRGLAERHPKATEAIRAALSRGSKAGHKANGNGNGQAHEITRSTVAQGLNILKEEKQAERKRLAQAEAEAGLMRAAASLSPLSPKLPAEAWGFVVEKQAEAAMSPEMSHSVRAAEFVGRATDFLQADKAGTVQALQVNVHLDGLAAGRLVELGLLGEVVEGVVRETDTEGEA